MAGIFWRSLARVVESSRQRIKQSPYKTRLPLMRYTYLFEYPRVIVVPELELCFIPTPKAANRSMKIAIANRIGMRWHGDIHHAPWQYIPLALTGQQGCYCIGFVRNPLDRLLSCYAQKIVYYERQLGMAPLLWRYGKTFNKDMSFADFVLAVSKIPDRLSDIHFRSQHTFFYHRGKLMADFVGRFERLDEDWAKLREKFDLPVLPHQNRSSHRDFRSAYTPELAAMAAKRYERDIEMFSYAEEVEALLK